MSTTDISPNDAQISKFSRFLTRHVREDLGEVLDDEDERVLWVDWEALFRFDRNLAEDYLTRPHKFEPQLRMAVNDVPTPFDIPTEELALSVHNLPAARQFTVGSLAEPEQFISEFVTLSGQVSKRTEVRPKLEEAAFECQRCGTLSRVPQPDNDHREPHECQGCERDGPFDIDYNRSEWTRQQVLRLQQPPEDITTGQGATIDVYLEGALTDIAETGDRVDIAGILGVEQPSDDAMHFEPYLDARSTMIQETEYEDIEIDEETEAEIKAIAAGERGDPYELGVDSLAPKIHDEDDIKLALLLQLFSGWQHEYPDGTTDRGDSHILLIGDPGCGKSNLLRAVEELAPRSTYASGKGMSAAGATAAAVQDDFGDGNSWSLEAGALVTANNGVACIDEIDKVDEDAVSSLHDALESQRINVSKAGINTSLPAETSLLAAGNPEYGRFDTYQPIAEQIDLGPTLISRFDLIFTMQDRPDPDRDEAIAEQIVDGRDAAGRLNRGDDIDDAEREDIEPAIERDTLRAYIAYARKEVYPVFANDAVKDQLVETYVDLRLANGEGDDSAIPVTARKLEAFLRLCEASARVRLSETIEMSDVRRVRQLVMSTLADVGIDPESGEFDTDLVETGNSKSQRDGIKSVVTLIAELEQEYDSGAPYEELIDRAADIGLKESKVNQHIETLRKKGTVYECQQDHLKVVPQ